jgi:hypothetical protein
MKYAPPELPDDLRAELRLMSRGDAAVRLLAAPSPLLQGAPPYDRTVAALAYLVWLVFGIASRDGGFLSSCKFPSDKWARTAPRVRSSWLYASRKRADELLTLLCARQQMQVSAESIPVADVQWWRRVAQEIDPASIDKTVLNDVVHAAQSLYESRFLWETHGAGDRGTANAGPAALAEGITEMLPAAAAALMAEDDEMPGAHPDDPIPSAPAEPPPAPKRKPKAVAMPALPPEPEAAPPAPPKPATLSLF